MLDIFYKEVIYEAITGTIESDGIYNILFNTYIPEKNIFLKSDLENNNLFIPTLIINNKKEFDDLLTLYVKLSLKFYDDSNYYMEYVENDNTKIKTIMTLLWSNATLEDYNNPILFLKKRINFFKNSLAYNSENIGYSNILDSNIFVNNIKNNIKNETPYALNITLEKEDEKYELPLLYYGITDNTAYIYAIQNKKNFNIENTKFQKNIKRKLYGLDSGIDVHEETFENYGLGNIKDITHSFLLLTNIATSIFKKNGIKKIVIPSILISRWNSKEIMFSKRNRFNNFNIEEYQEEHNRIQQNLTDKFIRTFMRLSKQNTNIVIESYPSELSLNMTLSINDYGYINNDLLEETFTIEKQKNNRVR